LTYSVSFKKGMSMGEEQFSEYLVLGGLRHGEVWSGPVRYDSIELPVKADK
jgi:hypothetical protein